MDSSRILDYQVMDSQLDPEISCLTIMCRATRFQITASFADLHGSIFALEYSQLAAKVDDMDGGSDADYNSFCDWIVKPCLAYFQLATSHILPTLTVEDFFFPPTHYLKLVVSGFSLLPEAHEDDGTLDPFVLMIPSTDIPQHPQLQYLHATDLQVVPAATTESYDYLSELPRKATTSDGKIMFFKPAIDRSQIIREIDTHARILDAGLRGKIRVSNLHGVVVSKDETMTLGLLFDLIPSIGQSLHSERNKLDVIHHEKWRQQITDIVKELHSHGIVWGDVHPGNIVIDENFDAWAVDFGGGCISEFVDSKKAGTVEGDWQGVSKIFDEWIVR